uniref:hypothetical protein n=1 Tax=Acetobacterium wieringae TaxID=52694 RepID=UPI0026EB4A03
PGRIGHCGTFFNEAVQKNTDINIDFQVNLNQYLYLYFFMGRSPKRRRSETETELHGFIKTAVTLRDVRDESFYIEAIWRLTRRRRSVSYAEVPHERVKRQYN